MAYTDFTTAFTDWSSIYGDAQMQWADAVANFNDAYYFYGPTTDFENSLALAVGFIINTINDINFYAGGPDVMDNAMYASVFFAGSGTVNMTTILQAMNASTFPEIREFLSLNWAYQQIMWDQPFFPEEYTALVNRLRT